MSRFGAVPELNAVEYLVKAHQGSLSVAPNEGDLPLVVACKARLSLDIMLTLLRAYPDALSFSTRTTVSTERG